MAITTIGTNGIADNIITGAKVALASQAAGDVMYYNGTDWIRVAIGTDGQVLTVNNAENAPGWEAGGAPLTPWTENITAANFTLSNVGATGNNWTSTALTVQSTTNAKLRLVIGSGDASIVFEGPTNWVVGLDNSASDQFVIGNDTALGGDDSLRITTDGAVTMPKQPAFLASDRTDTANQTGDGTWYIEIFSGEIFDQNGDYDSVSTFTAPVTGKYHLSVTLACGGVTSSHTSGNLAIMVSNHVNETFFHPWNNWAANEYGASIVGTFLVDMDASDTAYVRIKVQNGAKTVDFNDNGSSGTHASFSGFLVA